MVKFWPATSHTGLYIYRPLPALHPSHDVLQTISHELGQRQMTGKCDMIWTVAKHQLADLDLGDATYSLTRSLAHFPQKYKSISIEIWSLSKYLYSDRWFGIRTNTRYTPLQQRPQYFFIGSPRDHLFFRHLSLLCTQKILSHYSACSLPYRLDFLFRFLSKVIQMPLATLNMTQWDQIGTAYRVPSRSALPRYIWSLSVVETVNRGVIKSHEWCR